MANMKTMRDWYFEGYEIKTVVKNGKTKRVYGDYKGKYYSLGLDAAGLTRFRIIYFTLFLVYLAAYIFTSLWPSKAASSWPGLINLFNMIPIIYLIIGSFYFLIAKPQMTIRSMYSSVNSIIKSLYGVLILSIFTVISGIIYIANEGISIIGSDGIFLVFALGCTAISAVLLVMWKKHPCEEIKVKNKA